MKLSISNLAWSEQDEPAVLHYLREKRFDAIELAPSKVFGERPYERIEEARAYAASLKDAYGLAISSLQSIWFGCREQLCGSAQERELLFEYTCAAIRLAHTLECGNLVFGCPKNRRLRDDGDIELASEFFRRLGTVAVAHGVVLALEANPKIYATNFMNTTAEAIAVCKQVASPGVGINLDLGAIIENDEALSDALDNLSLVNHIHISEPWLELIKRRTLYRELFDELKKRAYKKYISIEMKQQKLADIRAVVDYVEELAR